VEGRGGVGDGVLDRIKRMNGIGGGGWENA